MWTVSPHSQALVCMGVESLGTRLWTVVCLLSLEFLSVAVWFRRKPAGSAISVDDIHSQPALLHWQVCDYKLHQVRFIEANHCTNYRQTEEADENMHQAIEPAIATAEVFLRREGGGQEKASFLHS